MIGFWRKVFSLGLELSPGLAIFFSSMGMAPPKANCVFKSGWGESLTLLLLLREAKDIGGCSVFEERLHWFHVLPWRKCFLKPPKPSPSSSEVKIMVKKELELSASPLARLLLLPWRRGWNGLCLSLHFLSWKGKPFRGRRGCQSPPLNRFVGAGIGSFYPISKLSSVNESQLTVEAGRRYKDCHGSLFHGKRGKSSYITNLSHPPLPSWLRGFGMDGVRRPR